MTKVFVVILCLLSCNERINYKTVDLNKTQKIKVQESWESEYAISYLWSKPQGPPNHNSSWIVNQNIMLFTPDKPGNYTIKVSIQNSMGKILGEEEFYYNVLNDKYSANIIDNSSKNIIEKQIIHKPKSQPLKIDNGYTVQISSWKSFQDAENNMIFLKNHGFNAYIKKIILNKHIWYRVRSGENLSYNECIKIKNKLEKISMNNIWIDKY